MKNPIAIIEIEEVGKLEFELFLDVPQSTANFIELAESKFYDGLNFHRIIPGFVAQGGCPNGNGVGGPGYNIEGEFENNNFSNPHTHKKGAIAWARSMSRNSAGSQFYIALDKVDFLDKDYAVFGSIVKGEELLEQLDAIGTQQGTPTKDLKIISIVIDRNGSVISKLKKIK